MILILLLVALPWLAVWFGMYRLHSLVATFFLYHFVCLLPAVIVQRKLWLPHWKNPTANELKITCTISVVSCAVAAVTYNFSGNFIMDSREVLAGLSDRGFNRSWLIPLSIYFITVNPILEELFWRGVIYNWQKKISATAGERSSKSQVIFNAMAFAGWHYMGLSILIKPVWLLVVLVGIAISGFVLAKVYDKSESITYPILLHGLVLDLPIMTVLAMLLQKR